MDRLERKAKQKELKLNNKQLKELHNMIQNCDVNDLVVKSIVKEYITVHPRNRKIRKLFNSKFKNFDISRLFKILTKYTGFDHFLTNVKVNKLPIIYGKRKRRSSKFFSRHSKHKQFRFRRPR
jgi:hypothetical protein